jgi:glutaryl-CoA transferase
MRPLEGVRVLEIARILAGPWVGQLLADLGADVVKVERPGAGDDTRGWGPPFVEGEDGTPLSAAYFHSCNRGKRSVAVDFETHAGRETVRRLASRADVLIENFKVGGLAKYGLDHATLRAAHPRLVYCSITGFGQTGPYAPRAGYDFIIQGMSGFMSVTGERDDLPGGGPQKAGVAISDLMTGMYATVAISAALAHRDRTGQGQWIDCSLFDSAVAMMATMSHNYLVTGTPPARIGNAHQNIVPYNVFACADGHLILAVGNDSQFAKFCAAAGKPEWAADPRFAKNADRVRNRDALVPLIAAIIRGRTQKAWLGALEPLAIPCGPINRMDQVFADPQIIARGMRKDLRHPLAGAVPQVRTPLEFSATPLGYDRPPPLLGEHTAAILRERLGMADDAIAALAARDVIQMRP